MRKSIFHEDWWLDAVAPGSWRDVTCIRGGHVVGYLRFVERFKGGFKTCEMPQITRLLGPVVMPQSSKAEVRNRAARSVIAELLEAIEEYDHVQMTLDAGFTNLEPFLVSGYEVTVQPTFLLDCNRTTDELWLGLRDKARNVIRRARECLTVCEIDDVNQFVEFYEKNLGDQDHHFDLSLIAPVFAAAHARNQCKIISAVDSNGTAHAKVLLVWDDKYVHFFLSTRDKEVAHWGAVSLLVWTGIELAQARGLCFDFDGGIATNARFQFLVAFGGELSNRFEISRSTTQYRIARTLARTIRRTRQTLVKQTVPGRPRSQKGTARRLHAASDVK